MSKSQIRNAYSPTNAVILDGSPLTSQVAGSQFQSDGSITATLPCCTAGQPEMPFAGELDAQQQMIGVEI